MCFGKHSEEIVELAAGDHHQFPARSSQPLERGNRCWIHPPIVGECTVVVCGQGEVPHDRPRCNRHATSAASVSVHSWLTPSMSRRSTLRLRFAASMFTSPRKLEATAGRLAHQRHAY